MRFVKLRDSFYGNDRVNAVYCRYIRWHRFLDFSAGWRIRSE